MPVLFISSLHRKLASEAKPSDMNEVNCLNGLFFSRVYSEADSFFYRFLFMLNPCVLRLFFPPFHSIISV